MVPAALRVRRTVRETDDTWTLELEPPPGGELPPFEPGQFNMLYAFGVGEAPISICGDPAERGALVHTIRAVGSVTEALCAAQAGEQLGVRGPYGSAWPVAEAEGGDLVIVAGGLGLAPLRPALLSALHGKDRFRSVSLLYGGRQPEQLLYREELARWASEPGLSFGLTVDSAAPGWSGDVGVVTKLIERAQLDPGSVTGLLCGPEVMMRLAVRALRDRGVPAESIHVSIERNMKCAITHCGRCQFGPTFACREGPVMRLSEIEPFFGMREV